MANLLRNALLIGVTVSVFFIVSWLLPRSINDKHLEAAIRQHLELSAEATISRQQLHSVDALSLRGLGLTQIEGLGLLTRLRTLSLDENAFSSLPDLKGLDKLEVLSISHNNLNSMNGISEIAGVRMLDISNNSLTEIHQLGNMCKISHLDISNNKTLTNIISLGKVATLESLHLFNTSVSDISFLANMPNLTFLDISHTSVMDIGETFSSKSLRTLIANNNGLTHFDDRIYSSGLTTLSLQNNNIHTLPFFNTPIDPSGVLMTINLSGNPLDSTATEQVIPELIRSGITVIIECKDSFNDPTHDLVDTLGLLRGLNNHENSESSDE